MNGFFKGFKNIVIVFVILAILFGIGFFSGRKSMADDVSVDELERIHSQYQNRIDSLESTLRGNEEIISNLREYNTEFEGVIEELRADRERFENENYRLGETIEDLERDRKQRDSIISELSERIGAFEEGIGGIDQLLQDIYTQNE